MRTLGAIGRYELSDALAKSFDVGPTDRLRHGRDRAVVNWSPTDDDLMCLDLGIARTA